MFVSFGGLFWFGVLGDLFICGVYLGFGVCYGIGEKKKGYCLKERRVSCYCWKRGQKSRATCKEVNRKPFSYSSRGKIGVKKL